MREDRPPWCGGFWPYEAPDASGKRRLICTQCGFVTPRTDKCADCVVGCAMYDPMGLGDWIAVLLAKAGITKPRATRLFRWLRLIPPPEEGGTCPCGYVQKKLNQCGWWCLAVTSLVIRRLRKA